MGQLLIIEGADNVGKTTLVNNICAIRKAAGLDTQVLKYGAPESKDPEKAATEQRYKFMASKQWAMAAKDGDGLMIMDRSYVGEHVYSYLGKRPYPEYIDKLHDDFVALGAKYIMVKGSPFGPPNDKLDNEYRGQWQMVMNRFLSFFASHRQQLMILDNGIFNGAQDKMAKEAVAWLDTGAPYNMSQEIPPTAWPIELGSYKCSIAQDHPFYASHTAAYNSDEFIGPMYPHKWDTALFGEAPGQHGCGRTGIPFYGDASGCMFRNILVELGLNMDLMFAGNVFHSTPPGNDLLKHVKHAEIASYEVVRPAGGVWAYPKWLAAELDMFANDVYLASRYAKQYIAVGRTAQIALSSISKQMGCERPTINVYHPAYFLHRAEPEAAIWHYYKEFTAGGIECLKPTSPDPKVQNAIDMLG